MVTVVFLVLAIIFIFAIFKGESDVEVTNKVINKINNTEKKPIDMDREEIKIIGEEEAINNVIILSCKEQGFIEFNPYGEEIIKIYDPTEKSKDDLFDNVFEYYVTGTRWDGTRQKVKYYGDNIPKEICVTRCVQNLKTGEEITVIIQKDYFLIHLKNKLNNTTCSVENIVLCYSKREIEKKEIEKQIAKLSIPTYINCDFDVKTNSLKFAIDGETIEDLTINREVLTKEKILENIRECKKKYTEKQQPIVKITNQIQDLFNE